MVEELSKKAKLSVVWNTGFSLFRDGLQFCVMLVLVRILDPDIYGKFGLVNSVIGFVAVLSVQNFMAHIIQVRSEDEVLYDSHFSFGLLIQSALFIITNVVALFLNYFKDYSEIIPLVHLMSFIFLFEWPCELRLKMLERELDWKRRRVIHGIGLILSSVFSIIMAMNGFGVYSLLMPLFVVPSLFVFDLFVLHGYRPVFDFKITKYMSAIRFGVTRVGSSITLKARPLVEAGLIVQLLDFSSVGLLGRAIGLSTLFCQRVATQLMYAIYPVLAKIEIGTEKYKKISELILKSVTWSTMPIAVLMSLLSTQAVTYLYGEKWLEVIDLLPWAMCIAFFSGITHCLYMFLLGQNNYKLCLLFDLVSLITTTVLVFALIQDGLIMYLRGMTFASIVIVVIISIVVCQSRVMKFIGIFMSLWPPLLGTAISVIICSYSYEVIGLENNNILNVIIYGSLFIFVYVATIRVLFKKQLKELISYMPANVFFERTLLLN
jgi:O-antigen/teichoic acid export membrane protein